MATPDLTDGELEQLIACPSCDALYRAVSPGVGARATCERCHHVLITPIAGAALQIVALALTILVLLTAAVFTPFLSIEANGLKHSVSIFDATLAFAQVNMIGLTVLVTTLIVVVPLLRMLLLLFVLVPMLLKRPPFDGAGLAFRWSEDLRPWSMAEIFVLGVGVALVKIANLAHVEIGTAFWLFAALVVVTVFQDRFLCRWTIWGALESGHLAPEEYARRGAARQPAGPEHG
ncbi:paraquat-inducible protein A [Tropicimonas sp. IMCC34043]|uniref:paraquat-inducible protein A n=1 Tax=Tropicimonas sp. IMCC34043 TaxID=2248760 RepID=UPI001E3C67E5|nr:paraquat-inducible protein A [Tropicimonas sp. IMCC34043]